jgi:hypothetical protein
MGILLGLNSEEDKLQDVQKMNIFGKTVVVKMMKIEKKWILQFGIHVFSKFVLAILNRPASLPPDVHLLQIHKGKSCPCAYLSPRIGVEVRRPRILNLGIC